MQAQDTTPGAPRALLYLRVSSVKQEDGYSLATQEAGCRRYCAEQGYTVVEVFREVFTGTEIEHRPQLRALRDRLKRGDIQVVVCYDPDRASRAGLGPSLYLRESVKLAGARLEYVLKSYSDDLAGDLLFAIDSWRAAEEIERLRERTRRGRRARVESGLPLPGPRPPYGYRWTDARKSRPEPDPATAPVVQRIFALVAGGATLGTVARQLTSEGVPSPSDSPGQPPRPWLRSTLGVILANPAYVGRPVAHRYRTERVDGLKRARRRDPAETIPLPAGSFPALVDEATWQAVRATLEANKRKTRPHPANPTTHLLRGGHAVCGSCGATLYPTPAMSGGQPPGYRCGRKMHQMECPAGVAIAAHRLDGLVWERVVQLLTDPAILAGEIARRRGQDPTAGDRQAIERALASIASQRANYVANLGLVSGQAAALIVAKLADLERDEARLVAEREAVLGRQRAWRAAQARLDDLQRWCQQRGADLDRLTFAERRDVLVALNVRATVYPRGHQPRVVIEAEVPLPPPPDDGVDLSNTD
jgi:site-specific DNA recombinase